MYTKYRDNVSDEKIKQDFLLLQLKLVETLGLKMLRSYNILLLLMLHLVILPIKSHIYFG